MSLNFDLAFSNQKTFFRDHLYGSSVEQRKHKLKQLKRWIIEHKQQIRDALYSDFRKPEVETDLTEIKTVLWEIDHVLSSLHEWTSAKRVGTTLTLISTRASVKAEPLGLVLIIAPWNFPFNLCIGPLVSAIAAGNCVFLKPSEFAPATSSLISNMIATLYPPEEVTVVEGDATVSKKLLELPFDHIFFTGSTAVGRYIMEAAAKNFSGVTLELGGMNPAVVAPGCNFKDVAEKIIFNKGMNAGQSCLGINYVLIQKQDEEKFYTALVNANKKLYPESGDEIAALIHDKHYERVSGLLDEAILKGAELVIGNKRDASKRYLPITIIKNVSGDSRILWEEIFGPVLPVVSVNSIDDAIHFIRQRPKPLATYIFSKNKAFTEKVLSQISSGTALINDTTLQFIHPHLPFGGVNQSGFGKAHGHYGFLAFSNQKAILRQIHGLSTFKLAYPQYTIWVKKIVKVIFDWF